MNDVFNIDPEVYGRIVCAALFHNNTIYMAREGHHAIFTMEPIGVLRCAKQGFVTENGYFVDRKTALYIAMHFDQIVHKHNPIDSLNSEDLDKQIVIPYKEQDTYSYKLQKNFRK